LSTKAKTNNSCKQQVHSDLPLRLSIAQMPEGPWLLAWNSDYAHWPSNRRTDAASWWERLISSTYERLFAMRTVSP